MRAVQEMETAGFMLLRQRFGALLSERELEVASLAISGLSTATIADRLFLSVNTVKTHLRNIFKKTNTTSRIDLFLKVIEMQEAHSGLAAGKTHVGVILCVEGDASAIPAMIQHLAEAVRPADLILPHEAGVIQVILADVTPTAAREVASRLCKYLQEWGEREGVPVKTEVQSISTYGKAGTEGAIARDRGARGA